LIDSTKRSLVKTAIFRSIIAVTSIITTWIFVGNLEQTTMIAIVFNIAATIIYYVHERIWNKISWGKIAENKDSLELRKAR
jgi:uncharacterized membrane protein